MNIGIIGLGLIGGSIGRALVKRTDNRVFAYDVDDEAMLKGSMLQAYHEPLSDDKFDSIDILIIALYPRLTASVMEKYASKLRAGAILIDCAGNKREVVATMRKLAIKYPSLDFVSTHPMAGREYSGVKHSTTTLYDKASVILIPVTQNILALDTVKKMYLSIGAENIVITDEFNHDKMIAYTSQLAHIVSTSYVQSPEAEKHYGYSAGSFRDMTRVAKLNPKMWSELMCDNRDNLSNVLNTFIEKLNEIKLALDTNDEKSLELILANGNAIKEEIETNKIKKMREIN